VSESTGAKAVAEGILGRIESAKLTGRGEVDVDGRLLPGKVIDIEDLDPDWNGSYYLTGVEHVFGRSQPFITRFTFGPLEPTTMVDMFGHQAPTTRERLTAGIVVGKVTDTKDPDGRMRVKVTLPVLSEDNVSHWARVISPGAGPDRGSVIVPEIDDEVAVAFENGDPQRPYVLGGLWNGKADPPKVGEMITNGKVMSRSFTSRTGHQLLFSDGDGDEDLYVMLALADGKTFVNVGHTMIEIQNQKKPIKITNQKATVELAENGDITIAGENITIEGKKDVTIKGQNVTIEAKAKFAAKGNSGSDLTSGGPVKVQGGPMTEIKGGMVKIN
jgi:uncharacterized protein involved in type VI secretion and phage assembly